MSVHTITTPEQEQVLRQAATLSRMLQQTWSRADSYDVVILLVAELLEVHADTGIDLGTWPVPLAVVVSHLAQDPEGREVLHAAAIERGSPSSAPTAGTGARRSPSLPASAWSRRRSAWWRQIQAPSAADAVGFAIRSPA